MSFNLHAERRFPGGDVGHVGWLEKPDDGDYNGNHLVVELRHDLGPSQWVVLYATADNCGIGYVQFETFSSPEEIEAWAERRGIRLG